MDRRRGALSSVAIGVAVVVGSVLVLRSLPGGLSLHNPVKTTTKEREHGSVLLDLRDVSRYEAASGQYQVVVDLEKDVKYVPSIIAGEHVTFMAEGDVTATVDFRNLANDAIELSDDRSRATVTLPPVELSEPRIDPDQSRVLSDDKGLVTKVGSALGNGDHDQELYQRAEEKLAASARRSELRSRAEANTRQMLTGLLGELGVDHVEVVFEDGPSHQPET